MKIILSRKGVDSASGGCPSPILPDGRLRCLPIPDHHSAVKYASIYAHDTYPTGDIVESLTKKKISATSRAHLDPDIDPRSKQRESDWRGVFGQCGASQSHLEKQQIGVGDIFLFFGLYRHTKENECGLKFDPNFNNEHIFWGWLQIEKIIPIDCENRANLQWCHDHPHIYYHQRSNNSIYIASKAISLPGIKDRSLAGAGIFPEVHPHLRLTAVESTRPSLWRLPKWFSPKSGRPLSYHTAPERWQKCPRGEDAVLWESVGRGQEFVIDIGDDSEATEWLGGILNVK
jgi:hypothetical protein